MSIFAVEYHYHDLPDVRAAALAEHRAYVQSLADDGRLLGSGPYVGGAPGALLVFRVDGPESLDTVLAADPFARVGVLSRTAVHEWDLLSGLWATTT